ncbi:hypothetical protein EMPS_06581 [Entomortierella parvispora]|uniref:Ricin B lectin domain-containing protein n=1 Tax=Entomortierella parvispora TaxID=205924 RepID=A0A9P3HD94_9FUNG|nr:hypothetical protein EMPS_06581 [Entomortierella parvispora]
MTILSNNMLSLRASFLIYTALSVVLICVSSQSLYKIFNHQYRDQALDYTTGNRIVGCHINYDSNNQNWRIVHLGDSFVAFQNAATGLFIGVNGQEIVAGANPYKWQYSVVSSGWYQILTEDGSKVLFLTGQEDYDPVILKEIEYKGPDAQWGYTPAPSTP